MLKSIYKVINDSKIMKTRTHLSILLASLAVALCGCTSASSLPSSTPSSLEDSSQMQEDNPGSENQNPTNTENNKNNGKGFKVRLSMQNLKNTMICKRLNIMS